MDQTCDTRVAPLEHQSLFKVFLPNLNRAREAHLRQVHSHTKRNIQQTLPHSQFHLLLCDAETKRKKKKTHNTLHFACTRVGAGSNQSQSHPLTRTNILTPLCFSHSPLFSCYFFLSPTASPRSPATFLHSHLQAGAERQKHS